jgi:hypothetical protein
MSDPYSLQQHSQSQNQNQIARGRGVWANGLENRQSSMRAHRRPASLDDSLRIPVAPAGKGQEYSRSAQRLRADTQVESQATAPCYYEGLVQVRGGVRSRLRLWLTVPILGRRRDFPKCGLHIQQGGRL